MVPPSSEKRQRLTIYAGVQTSVDSTRPAVVFVFQAVRDLPVTVTKIVTVIEHFFRVDFLSVAKYPDGTGGRVQRQATCSMRLFSFELDDVQPAALYRIVFSRLLHSFLSFLDSMFLFVSMITCCCSLHTFRRLWLFRSLTPVALCDTPGVVCVYTPLASAKKQVSRRSVVISS